MANECIESPITYTACSEGSVSLIYVSLTQQTRLLLLCEHKPASCAVISQE